jgi:hypothetical protein
MMELRLHYLDLEIIPQRTAHLSHTNDELKLNLSITEQHVLQLEASFIRRHITCISRDIKSLTT